VVPALRAAAAPLGALVSRRPDPEQLDQDELAARRRERDRHREPGLVTRDLRALTDLSARRAFAISVVDTRITALACPLCNGPVFADHDSDGERIDCTGPTCEAQLVTRRNLDGSVSVAVVGASR
jgi:hypothetical protein